MAPPVDARPSCAVFDVDGVLADVRHRLHHLERRPKDWGAFFGAMSEDPPLAQGIEMAREEAAGGSRVVYLTGRNERYRQQTSAWLTEHGCPQGQLVMRPDHDRRPARFFKPEALRRLATGLDVTVVVDDDEAVVTVLRAARWNVVHATWMPESAPEQQTLFGAQETEGRT